MRFSSYYHVTGCQPSGSGCPSMSDMSSLTAEVKVRPHKDEEYACLPNRHSLDGSARAMENTTSDIPPPHTLKASVTPNDHPDGGLEAWLVLFGTMCSTFTTFGYVNAWGVFQAYYQHTILAEHSPSSIAWIGSIQYSLVFLPGLVVGRLFDLGYFRIVSVSSSVLLLVATFLVAECTAYWQFLLCQGLATGMACGGFFGPSTAILAQWFRKRRGLALGLFSAGASVGGTVIPTAARSLIPRIGFQWTVRVIGFILFSGLLLANLTMKPRLSPAKPTGGIASVPLFKCAKFTAHCVSAFVIYMGFYTLPTYVAATATSVGISPQSAFYLVSVANGCSGVGRLLAGPMADRLGPMNVSIPFTALTGLMTYVWPFTKTPVSLISITALYGLSSGAYASLLSTPILDLGEPQDLGRRIGILMTFVALGGLLGPPMSGLVGKAFGMQAMGIYAGSILLVGVLLMAVTHYNSALRRLWTQN